LERGAHAALLTPVFSLGPFLDTDRLYAAPWRAADGWSTSTAGRSGCGTSSRTSSTTHSPRAPTDPAAGGAVLFGPAVRPLPQLPLAIDEHGHLRAAGRFSDPVGPSWWGVRMK
jgi:hypothetical protein